MSRYAVGLTGGIGSGKSSVARLFEVRGVEVIDADAIAHALTQAGGAAMAAIRAQFGEEVVDARGALDRARMRARVFTDDGAKERLERILHPMIRDEAERRAAAAKSPYVIQMIPLLVESGDPHERFQRVLVVDCPEGEQVRRVMARSGLARDTVEAIIAAQASRADRLAVADDVIDNSADERGLEPQVERLHREYLRRAIG